MRRRLRKKLRVGEFEEVIIPIAFELAEEAPPRTVDHFVDEFLDVVESLSLGFGGGGRARWSGFAQSSARWIHPTEQQADALRSWLAERKDVLQSWVGAPMTGSEVEECLRENPDFPTVTSGRGLVLEQLATEALEEYRAGRTEELGFDEL